MFHKLEKHTARASVLVVSSLWLGLIVTTPLFDWNWGYDFFSVICHQDSERSWHIDGRALAVCIRCTSIYAGFLVAIFVGTKPNKCLLISSIILTALEFLIAQFLIDLAVARSITGLMLGFASAGCVIEAIEQLTTKVKLERSYLEKL